MNIPEHFKGKEAIEHVVDAQAEGLIASSEIHGAEIPGHISAFADAGRETATVLLLLWTLFSSNLTVFLLGWLVWKTGRSAWLAWSRLERLHRIVEQEQWEITHNKEQEREELKALYAAKGFEGKLLEDVLDVLMSDGDKLLRVMVEEELGLKLLVHEHPLKQGLWAGLGVILSGLLFLASLHFFPVIAALIIVGGFAALSAVFQQNKVIPAVVWNIALTATAFGFTYFMSQYAS